MYIMVNMLLIQLHMLGGLLMKRIVCLGLALCVMLLGFAYAEGNSACVCMTEFLPETVPDLICSTYKIDESTAVDVLMKAPYLTKDTKRQYMATEWSNDDETMTIGFDGLLTRLV